MGRRVAYAGVATAAAGLLLAGCGGSSTPQSHGSEPPVASPADQLATLAQKGATASYTATYRLQTGAGSGPLATLPPLLGGTPSPSRTTAPSGTTATVTVYRTADALRLDVTAKASTAVLIENAQGRYSCRLAGASKVCFTVAGPGGALPPEFDPGLQRVFTSYLGDLAQNADSYSVRETSPTGASGDVPAGQCFTVGRAPASPSASPGSADEAIPGVYCLADTGVVTAVHFEGGSLDLTALGGAPTAKQLQPPVKPTPLPTAPAG